MEIALLKECGCLCCGIHSMWGLVPWMLHEFGSVTSVEQGASVASQHTLLGSATSATVLSHKRNVNGDCSLLGREAGGRV